MIYLNIIVCKFSFDKKSIISLDVDAPFNICCIILNIRFFLSITHCCCSSITKYSSSVEYNNRLLRQAEKQIDFYSKNIENVGCPRVISIKKGDIFSEENLSCKRPALGLSPYYWKSILGKRAKKDYKIYDFIII